MRILISVVLALVAFAVPQDKKSSDDEKPRVFITDSQSWEMQGGGGGTGGTFGTAVHGGARPQTAEIIKTFGERCPQAMANNIQQRADYIVVLDHEGGKGFLRHRNKVAVFVRVTGDSIVSKSTLSLGGSVQDACEAINKDWAVHGSTLRAASSEQRATSPLAQPTTVSATVSSASLTGAIAIKSNPDSAEILVDGEFMGNTPANLKLSSGKHSIKIVLAGYRDWARDITVTAGSEVQLSATLEKQN